MSERNPTRFHGTYGEGQKLYIPVPFALHRNPAITPAAIRVAVAVFSNREGWEVSIKSIAADCGVSEAQVRAGIATLIAHRWMAREALTRNRYVLHVARVEPFTEVEHAKLNTYVPPSGKGPRRRGAKPEPGCQVASVGGGAESEPLGGVKSESLGGAKSEPEPNPSLNKSLNISSMDSYKDDGQPIRLRTFVDTYRSELTVIAEQAGSYLGGLGAALDREVVGDDRTVTEFWELTHRVVAEGLVPA
ncbi:hypothetical protein LK459_02645 [Gordonia otitidis]|uniref:hypothetical protein n=1 Tax=Gordonia otitidis TaxID=249058 RepID=UPI001D15207A|nr:hypothetical protein [Gordonia otitidis]UEA59807.1 hypothetical protein LK459_02645 [Gordonia otitidis]